VDDNDPFSDVDDNYNSEDADYYGEEDNEEDKAVPEGYDDEIAKIMEDVVSDSEEKVADAADRVKNTGEIAVAAAKTITNKVTGDNNEAAEKTVSNPSSALIDDDNRYMVVAGSFTSNANADQHASKLEKEGFTPEIVNFNSSRMYTVIASRYDNEAAALAAAKKLRNKKIDCYVHRKRQK
jgi:cell division protein FtsN